MSPQNICVALERARLSTYLGQLELEQILSNLGVAHEVALTLVEIFRDQCRQADEAEERAEQAESDLEELQDSIQTKLGEVVYEMVKGLSKGSLKQAIEGFEKVCDDIRSKAGDKTAKEGVENPL
jgi:hypothetical protein